MADRTIVLAQNKRHAVRGLTVVNPQEFSAYQEDDDDLTYIVDMSSYLDGATISSVTRTANGPTVSNTSNTTTRITQRLKGFGYVDFKVTTSSGDVEEFRINIEPRAGSAFFLTATASVPQNTAQLWDIVADVTAASIDSGVSWIRTQGYYTVGDGGGALYKRVYSAPSHGAYITSNAATSYWELAAHGASVSQVGAVGDGVTADTTAFTTAEATGRTVFVPAASYVVASMSTTTGAWFFDPQASIVDWFNIDLNRGPFVDYGDGSNVWRFADRVLVGASASTQGGSTTLNGRSSWIGRDSDAQAAYLERSATVASISSYGGVGVTGATRNSHSYTYYGYSVWTSGESVSIGAKRGYGEKLFTATTSGTCGSTPPTHSTGTASDGGVTWQFDRATYLTPIALAGFALADTNDGVGAWAIYAEAVNTTTGGGCSAAEIVLKNRGSNVSVTPYTTPAGATYGVLMNGGGDSSYGGAALNPASVGLIFSGLTAGKVWNSGIVFKQTAITGADGSGGSNLGTAIAFARGHKLDWYNSSGVGASIWGDVSDTAKYVQLVMTDDLFAVKVRGTTALSVGNAQLGFFATSPTSKATITGAKGGNVALANLLTELAAKGLITDSTT